jgi:hypothetical protein
MGLFTVESGGACGHLPGPLRPLSRAASPSYGRAMFSTNFGPSEASEERTKSASDLRREWDLNPRELALRRLFKSKWSCRSNRPEAA